jgi:hypothetical protein
LTERRQRELLVKLLQLYNRYGESSFRELARALREGSITKEIAELQEAVILASPKKPKLLRQPVRRKAPRDERGSY